MERRHLSCGLTVEMATTEEEWQQGLAGITEHSHYWGQYDGMLFCFDEEKCWAITTHKTLVTLYGYWLDAHERIVAMQELTRESSVVYVPLTPATYLLETIRPMNWRLGQRVRLEAVYDTLRHPNADLGKTQRIHDESAVLDDHANR